MTVIANIFVHPERNGFTLFTLGILFILSAYHFWLYFQHKDKTYLLYSFYTTLIFSRQCFLTEGDFIETLTTDLRPFFVQHRMNDSIVWIYNCVYSLFVFKFVDFKFDWPKHYKVFRLTFLGLIGLAVVLQLFTFFSGDGTALTFCYYALFIPIATFISVYALFLVWKGTSKVKTYALAGGIVLLLTSLATEYMGNFHWGTDIADMRFSVFYIGLIIENLFFSLGLGYKQKVILQERNASQKELINQLQENESLRETLNQQLRQEVSDLEEVTRKQEISRLKAEFEQQLAELKLASLQSQMNPHFLFNSLNSIKAYIIQNDTEKAVTYLNTFAKLMRKILAASRERSITLSEEVETAKLYIDIENLRFENAIRYEITVDPRVPAEGITVPPLILQPFIENSIWHGLAPKEGDKMMAINVTDNGNESITIRITDNGIGREAAQELKHKRSLNKNSVGMNITQERIERFTKDFHGKFSMEVVDLKQGEEALGTEVILEIPYD